MAPTTSSMSDEVLDALAARDFLRAAAADDVRHGRYGGQVVTRFPPEPNGYLHIGHAKAIVVDFGVARDFGGRCHLRMDDTNPTTESMEFAESFQHDIAWLGFDWGDHLYFASDMYEDMFDLALRLIDKGLAYVDEQTEEEIRSNRGTVTEPGVDSPWRDRPAAASRDRFERMRAGEFPDGSLVLRAKIDMAAANMLLRDPIIYRIKHHHHYRTGDAWCIYPMYDFAHCLEDALEGVTHSYCTLEFQDNRALYDWFIDKTDVVPAQRAPRQYEMARLELSYIITSKRKLKQLVDEGHVRGWDDPRMPTLAGLRRRGVPPEAIVSLVERVGVAKTNSQVDIALLEHAIRDELNARAPRRMGVGAPLAVTVDNWEEGELEWIEAPDFPPDVDQPGSRRVAFGRHLWIERGDFAMTPPKGFKRMSPGAVVRFRHGYVAECTSVDRDAAGEITCVHVRAFRDVDRGSAPAGVKVKGTIHWVEQSTAVPATLALYDRLFTSPTPTRDPSGRDFLELLNPDSLVLAQGYVEGALGDAGPGDRFQLERRGYFVVDEDTTDDAGRLLLNRTVALKDSWGKRRQSTSPRPAASSAVATRDDDRRRRKKRPASELRAEARAADPKLAAGMARLLDLGLSEDDADVLTANRQILALYEDALTAHPDPALVARTVVNDLRGLVSDDALADCACDGRAVGRLVALQTAGTLTSRAAREVLEVLVSEGGDPEAIMDARKLRSISDADTLTASIQQVLDQHPAELQRFRDGERRLLGFFMGRVMAATRGKADPQAARARLAELLDS